MFSNSQIFMSLCDIHLQNGVVVKVYSRRNQPTAPDEFNTSLESNKNVLEKVYLVTSQNFLQSLCLQWWKYLSCKFHRAWTTLSPGELKPLAKKYPTFFLTLFTRSDIGVVLRLKLVVPVFWTSCL